MAAAILDFKKCHWTKFCTPSGKCCLRPLWTQINRQKKSVQQFHLKCDFLLTIQQSGRHEWHEQCFCDRKYPMHWRDQSGRMQVRFVGPKISTPCRISAMIDSLEAWKALSSSDVYSNRHLGLRYGLNNVAQLCIVRNLIYRAEPAANVRGRCWRRKFADGVRVFWQGLDGFVRYAEPCEGNNSPREIECLCIEDDSCLAYTDEKVNGSPPVRL